MERPKQAATKVRDYRKYHLSGDLDKHIRGKVGQVVSQIEEMSTQQELEQKLEAQTEATRKLELEVAEM